MADPTLWSALILVSSLVALTQCEESVSEPEFPRLLSPSQPNQRKIHIVSEKFDSEAGYTQAEELIDLDLGKAAYIETSKGVRTTWLIDIPENTIHKYKPFTCTKDQLIRVATDTPNIAPYGRPKIETDESTGMQLLFGIAGLLESISKEVSKNYSRTATKSNTDDSERIEHKWRLLSDSNQYQIRFSGPPDAPEGQPPELVLNSIEIKKGRKTTTINVLSIKHELSPAAYHNELQLPLIYGCERSSKLAADMQAKFDLLATDELTRYHLKGEARATNYVGGNPSSSEPSSFELALSRPVDAKFQKSPVRAHMIRQANSQTNTKIVLDRLLGVLYEANPADGTCTIRNNGPMNLSFDINPISLKFSNELTLELKSEMLNSMLYGLESENFLKLEHHASHQFAYFASSFPDTFHSEIRRVVRKFSFHADGRFKFDSFAIWILDADRVDLTLREEYEFQITESKSLTSDAASADAFDMSQECYLNNPEMQEGRDYAWFELDYPLPAEQVESLRNRVDEFKTTVYRLIRSNLRLSYLRIPRMEVIFGGSGLTVRMLVLDSLLPHLVYRKFESRALSEKAVDASEKSSDLRACSEFCLTHRCFGMTFDRTSLDCNITKDPADILFDNRSRKTEDSVTYRIDPENQALLPGDEQRLKHLIAAQQSGGQSQTMSISNLHIVLDVNGQQLDLLPSGSRVVSTKTE